jgi:type III restriction enzyme
MTELKKYQKDAVERLKESLVRILSSGESQICVFQAPTGSGKTLMMAELLKKLAKENKKLSFVWISVRMLHEQSKEKLEKYYEDNRLLQCSYFEDLQDRKIAENEILFINWHSINKKDINIYVRENEQDNNLNSIIANTKEDGREIILIIDESHHTASSEKSRELINAIDPKVTIEVSATPQMTENIGEFVKVNLSDVKAEEMIKSEISVNPEFLNIIIGSKSSDEIVIEEALKKRDQLKNLYVKEGSNINPLLLIQLPDQRDNLIDKKEEIIDILKKKFNITEESGKLAIWLSEEKTNSLTNIEKNDNEVDVLVFKQAPALGWDCPRASILVIFRESQSFTFTIQTIGRIMRMPELKYYNIPELNKGYVFTNLPDIKITEDYARDYVTIYEAKRDNELYKSIEIPSIYLKRQRERTRLSGEFVKIFIEVATKTNLKEKITTLPSKVVSQIIADGKIINIDKQGEIEYKGKIDVELNELELQQKFDSFITQNCSPYAPVDSSDRLKTALYQFLYQEFSVPKFSSKAQKIVLGKENVQAFVDAINLAKEKYNKEIVEKAKEKRELIETKKWEIPAIISYNSRYLKENKTKSIMKPFYISESSAPEKQFIELLENSKNVKWWFKNGENEIKYFAVLRTDGGAFYPDFIIQFNDGKIGIFDTKSGRTAAEEDAGPRAEGLYKYLESQDKSRKRLFGGIVVNKGGTWRLNDNEKYTYDENLTNWKILEI